MKIRARAVVCVALLLSGCHGSRGPFEQGPLATYRLSGTVSEVTPTGHLPVEGARIEETQTHQHTTTDVVGFYSLSGLYGTKSTFLASKPGYRSDMRVLTISRDARLDLQLHRAGTSFSSSRAPFALPGQEAKQP